MKATHKFLLLAAGISVVALPDFAFANDPSSAEVKTKSKSTTTSAAEDPVRFNWVDGEPIHYFVSTKNSQIR